MRRALLWSALALVATAGRGEDAVKQVLMLQSFDRGILILDQLTGDFRVALDERLGKPVNIVQVVVGPTGFVGASDQAVIDYVQSLYVDRPPPDLVIAVVGPASAFARQHRDQLFPQTPLLFAGPDERWLRHGTLRANESVVPVFHDIPRIVDDILKILPETREVFLINGAATTGKFWHQQLGVELARFEGRVAFEWSDALALPEVLQRCASLPPHSAIVYLNFGFDASGGVYADERILAELRKTANAPLFGVHSSLLGHGIVGGPLIAIDDLARSVADVTARLLNGASPASVRLPPLPQGRSVFDWRELRRWNIPESRLPPDSEVRFRGPSLWSAYRLPVLGSIAALSLQSLLIARLLYERRARRRAEVESQRNLALAADANRRETMTALTNSIGHELGQPLTALMHNTEALRMMVKANQATQEVLGELLSDIQSEAVLATQIVDRHRAMLRSREIDRFPVDLRTVVDASLMLLAHDLRARQVETTLDLPTFPCMVDGDRVLLQQVVVNVVRNAIDAMTETPPARRQLTIRGSAGPTHIEVAVEDRGSGLSPEILDTLFTPFVTTKPHGLGVGLTISRSIVDAHGGTIAARSNVDGGSTFTVKLPRSTALGSRPPFAQADLEN